jgi:hypothetical protein
MYEHARHVAHFTANPKTWPLSRVADAKPIGGPSSRVPDEGRATGGDCSVVQCPRTESEALRVVPMQSARGRPELLYFLSDRFAKRQAELSGRSVEGDLFRNRNWPIQPRLNLPSGESMSTRALIRSHMLCSGPCRLDNAFGHGCCLDIAIC